MTGRPRTRWSVGGSVNPLGASLRTQTIAESTDLETGGTITLHATQAMSVTPGCEDVDATDGDQDMFHAGADGGWHPARRWRRVQLSLIS